MKSTCLVLALPRPWLGYGLKLLSAVLLATGCATAPRLRGTGGTYYQRHRELTWGADPSWARDTKRARQAEQGEEPSAQGRPQVPSGWPEEADSDEELLAPLLACASAADFLALQREVDMAPVAERRGTGAR